METNSKAYYEATIKRMQREFDEYSAVQEERLKATKIMCEALACTVLAPSGHSDVGNEPTRRWEAFKTLVELDSDKLDAMGKELAAYVLGVSVDKIEYRHGGECATDGERVVSFCGETAQELLQLKSYSEVFGGVAE